MKKTKTETKPAETPAENKPEEKPVQFPSLWEATVGLPTTEQLAMIAATLARNTNDTPDALATAAMRLWWSARGRIAFAVSVEEILIEEDKVMHLIYPPEYFDTYTPSLFGGEAPVTRDEFLKGVLTKYKNRTWDLGRIGKAFVRDVLRDRNKKEPTPEEISDAYGKWKPFQTGYHADAWAEKFVKWHRQYINEARRAAGLKSAAKRKADREAGKTPKRKAKKHTAKRVEEKALTPF